MFKNKFKNLMDKLQNNDDMLDDYDYNEDYEDYEDSDYEFEDEQDFVFTPKNNNLKSSISKSSSINKSTSVEKQTFKPVSDFSNVLVKVIKPLKVDDWRFICDDLKQRNVIIINFEGVSSELPQRITDYVAGACYVLNGKFRHINQNILIVVPDSITLEGDVERSLNDKLTEVQNPTYNYDNLDNLYN